ncbi:MAG: methyltransferase domain-containing protein [Betaproteobacteria bacterium]|nr:methyltransferase domain-containing protein [Betaproteobacteria bacterium]
MNAQVPQAGRLYAALAPQYDAETRFIRGIREQAIAALRLQRGESVLDAGCGTGWCLPHLARDVGPAGRVTGFEPSPEMLVRAEQRVRQLGLTNVDLIPACGATVALPAPPDAILFSYTHDLVRSPEALANLFAQCRPGTRLVATGTQLFPSWFALGNWYLRHTHRATITNFEGFEQPWSLLPRFCDEWRVRRTAPGSRYLFTGRLSTSVNGSPHGFAGEAVEV